MNHIYTRFSMIIIHNKTYLIIKTIEFLIDFSLAVNVSILKNVLLDLCLQHPIIYAIYYCKSMSSRGFGFRISISVIIHYSECKRRSKCHGTVLPVWTVYQNNKCARFFTLLHLLGQLWIANCFVTIFLTGMKLSHKVFAIISLMMNPESFLYFFSYQI